MKKNKECKIPANDYLSSLVLQQSILFIIKTSHKLLSFRKQVFQSALIAVTLIIYCRISTLKFQLEWDDYWVVINRYTTSGLNINNLGAVLGNFYHGQYSPINEFYYILIHAIFDYNPVAFHLIGLMVHLLNILLVFSFARRINIQAFGFEKDLSIQIAFLSALLFAIHPLNQEAVLWISASKILVYAFFYLLGLILYLKYTESWRIKYYVFSAILFILSFGAKEQAVTFPLALLLIDFVLDRDFRSKRVWLEKVPLLVLSLVFGLVTIFSQGFDLGTVTIKYDIFERLILAFVSGSIYITQSLLPVKLSYIYPFPFQPGEKIPNILYAYPVAIILGLVLLRKYFKNKLFMFGCAFFLIHILVALHILDLSRFSITADRYTYLSLIGVTYFIAAMTCKYAWRTNRKWIVFSVYLGGLCAYTLLNSSIWQSSKTLKYHLSESIKARQDYKQLQERFKDE